MGLWFKDLPKVKNYLDNPVLIMLSSEKFPNSSLLKFNEQGELENFKATSFFKKIFSKIGFLP